MTSTFNTTIFGSRSPSLRLAGAYGAIDDQSTSGNVRAPISVMALLVALALVVAPLASVLGISRPSQERFTSPRTATTSQGAISSAKQTSFARSTNQIPKGLEEAIHHYVGPGPIGMGTAPLVRGIEPVGSHFKALAPAQGISATISKTGTIEVTSTGSQNKISLVPTSYGAMSNKSSLSTASTNLHVSSTSFSGSRVTQHMGSVNTWYQVNSQGLEEGFTLKAPATKSTPASVIDLGSAANWKIGPGGTSIIETNTHTGAPITFGGLKSFDSNGRVLASHFSISNGIVDIVVKTARARFPITIDPTWSAATLPTSGLSPASSASPDVRLNSISCASATACVATGYYIDTSNNYDGFVETSTSPVTVTSTPPPTPIATSTTLTVSNTTPSPSSTVTLSVSVTSGSGTPSGTVTISSNATAISSCTDIPLNAGSATCTTSFATPGVYQLTAAFNGTSLYTASASSSVTVTVGSAPPTTTPPTTTPPTTTPTTTPPTCPTGQSGTPPNCTSNPGYIVVTNSGGVSTFGVTNNGSVASKGDTTTGPVVGAALTSNGGGYWLASSQGGVYSFGDAGFFGAADSLNLAAPIVDIQGTPDGKGYWLVGSDGGVFTFGDAGFYGSCPTLGSGCTDLVAPIVGITPTNNGKGYWEVAGDGGVFAFGDAIYSGSAIGNSTSPVVSIAASAGGGYWVVDAQGNVHAFGTAPSVGDCTNTGSGCQKLAAPIVSIQATPDGKGYWLIGADGGVFAFGDASFQGSSVGETGGSAAV